MSSLQKSQGTYYKTEFGSKNNRKEGDIKVDQFNKNNNQKGGYSNGGEYIDYEVIK
ncbi:MAG: hypothetical protein SFY32_01565 [Bacteroidota bacterium]|nr:hypothetical protein [Bacteroidota bacterium]